MEIVKDNSEEWEYRGKCSACDSELRIKADCIRLSISSEVKYASFFWDEEIYTANYYVSCPVCYSRMRFETVSPAKEKTKKVPHIQALRLKNEWMRRNGMSL